MVDILLTNEKGYYDFKVVRGEIVTTTGFETSLILSLFSDRRADISEVPEIELRHGWWGNLILRDILNKPLFEMGSKIWLTYQARSDQTTLNFIKNYVEEALIWLIEEQYVKNIAVTVRKETDRKIFIEIKLTLNNNLLLESVFELGTLGQAA